MFEEETLKLSASLADALNSIRILKNQIVIAQQYEQAAKMRDIEQKLEAVLEWASYSGSAAALPNSKNGREMFFKQSFAFAAANKWTIPNAYTKLFEQRKSSLNLEISFNDDQTAHLIALNQKLLADEDRVMEFLNFFNYVVTIKDIAVAANHGTIDLLCYTDAAKYTLIPYDFNSEKPFYRYSFPVAELLNCGRDYYKTGTTIDIPENDFLKPFLLKFREENICFLFYVLADKTLLSLGDLLNISKVELVLKASCGFGENEIFFKG